jgi:hypothetical protein
MRTALEGAPVALRRFVAAKQEYVVLEQQSRLVHASLLLRADDRRLTWATRVVYKTPASKPVCAVVGTLHRRISPYVLRRAARSL